jgi:hypothetical protein
MSSYLMSSFCIPALPAIQGVATGGGFTKAASSLLTMGAIRKDPRIARLLGNARGVNNSLVDQVFLIEVLFTAYGPAVSRGGAL